MVSRAEVPTAADNGQSPNERRTYSPQFCPKTRGLSFQENKNKNIKIAKCELFPQFHTRTMWLQQDGAPAHNANIVKIFLNEQFKSKWMGTKGPLKWPPRSPDLTPLDFFLWGHVKDIVYTEQSTSLADLKQRITSACNKVTPEMLKLTTNSIITRYEKCVARNGGHFENYK